MVGESQLGLYIVLAIYAVAGVLVVIGGIMAIRVRRRRRGH